MRLGRQSLAWPQPGLSLVETVMAVVVTGVVVASTMSAVQLVLGGASHFSERTATQNAVSLAMLRFRGELRMAATVTELTPQTVTFTHFDITGDDVDDVIRYAWSGTSGDPLTRELNGEGPVTILEGCTRFDLQADVVGLVTDGQAGWSDETLVAVHDQYPPEYDQSMMPVEVTRQFWLGHYFTPQNADSTRCRITRALVSLSRSQFTIKGNLLVSIRPTSSKSHWPSTQVLDEVSISVPDLPDLQQFYEIAFPGIPEVNVGDGTTIVLGCDSYNTANVGIGILANNDYDDGTCLFYSHDSGHSWNPHTYDNHYDLRSYIYGQFDNRTAVVESGSVRNMTVGLSAAVGEETLSADAAVGCINLPPIAGLPFGDLPIRGSY